MSPAGVLKVVQQGKLASERIVLNNIETYV